MSKVKCQRSNVSKGFSFVEMIVAIFIFALVVTASSGVFVKMIKSYKSAREIQRDLEDAQYAMNLMAKTIRTSSIISCYNGSWDLSCGGANITAIRIFDYSQTQGCIQYEFSGNKLKYISNTPPTPGDKNSCATWVPMIDLVSYFISNAQFDVKRSFPDPDGGGPLTGQVGKATISMQVCPASGCPAGTDKAIIQTSVSLRDYTETGL